MVRDVFSKRDLVLECDIGDLVEQWKREGMSLDQIIEILTQSYSATAQVCNVLTSFFVDLGDHRPTRRRRSRKNREDDETADGDFYDGRLEAERCVEMALSTLVVRYFSPEVADTIFEEDSIGIDWLPNLISHRCWRSFLYGLMEQHPHCLMLNFAMKLISDAGYQNEISSVNSAAQQLDIFSRVFFTSLEKTVLKRKHGESSDIYQDAFTELFRVVSQGEHTFVYTYALLKRAALKSKGWRAAASEHLAEELRLAISKRHLVEATSLRLSITRSQKNEASQHLTQAIFMMINKKELNPADVSLIYEHYIMPCAPPIDFIREPLFQELLFDALFHCDGPKVGVEHRDKYIYLVAYAASVVEKGTKAQKNQSRNDLDACRIALERALSLLECDDDWLTLLNPLIEVCNTAVVSSALLYFIHSMLVNEPHIGDVSLAVFVLLDKIATLHYNLQPAVFNICCDYYDKVSSESNVAEVIIERQRMIIDRLVHLLTVGSAIPVIERMNSMLEDAAIDASLVRYFLLEVLEIIAPPFSEQFVALMTPLVENVEIFDKLVLDRFPPAVHFINLCNKN
ncbi:unnamed protein product [Caenorhabditis auriculariae]|uniref:Uncharacterized protein n=1 Tax=Caenorhabditis auriculariae TaxID=2777116 RepID=A0A8S1GTI1_9PELO|nr:unnamed protein product [Caenorhabditis auriculariae]